jgi:hypothetical protein
MAKTNFVNGTIVQPSWLNSQNSHVHDGADDNGHAPLIDVSSHVSGVCSFSNLPNARHYGWKGGLSLTHEDRHITIGVGSASSKNSFGLPGGIVATPLIVFNDTLRKRILTDEGAWSPWSAGANSGSVPSTASGWSQAVGDSVWLHCFVLGKSTDRTAYEFGFDTSIVATNLREIASAWDMYRRVGSIRIFSDSAVYKITPFTNIGRRFMWKTGSVQIFLNYVDATLAISSQLVSTCIPPDVFVLTMNKIILDTNSISGRSAYVLVQDYNTDLYDISIFPTVFSSENRVYGDCFALSDTYKRVLVSATSNGNINQLGAYTYGWIEDVDSM